MYLFIYFVVINKLWCKWKFSNKLWPKWKFSNVYQVFLFCLLLINYGVSGSFQMFLWQLSEAEFSL
jgi:hypothetical protein